MGDALGGRDPQWLQAPHLQLPQYTADEIGRRLAQNSHGFHRDEKMDYEDGTRLLEDMAYGRLGREVVCCSALLA